MNIKIRKWKWALLLHYAGPDIDEIFGTLPNTGEDNNYDTAVKKLHKYFTPQVNTTWKVYNFQQGNQKEGELLDSYHTRLCQLAKTCKFNNIDRDQRAHYFDMHFKLSMMPSASWKPYARSPVEARKSVST